MENMELNIAAARERRLMPHVEAFVLRLCDLSDEDGGAAERAFLALSQGRRISGHSDRVWACFSMYCRDMHLSFSDRVELRARLFEE
jgi:hypothetical protein